MDQRYLSLPLLVTLLLLAVFGALGWVIVQQAEPVRVLQEVTITPHTDGVILGRGELAQRPSAGRAAERDHLLVKRTPRGWELGNVAEQKRVDAPTTRYRTRYLKRWRLRTGNSIQLNDTAVQVVSLTDNRLELMTENGRRALWQAGRLTFRNPTRTDGGNRADNTDICPAEGDAWWKRYLSRVRDIDLWLFSLGGLVDCTTRWSLNGVPSQAAVVHWYEGEFWLAPGRGDARVTMSRAKRDKARSFRELSLPLRGEEGTVRLVVVGRTYYGIEATAEMLRLTPIRGSDLWYSDENLPPVRDPQRVERRFETRGWIGGGVSLGTWLRTHGYEWSFLLSLTLISTLGFWIQQRRNSRRVNSGTRKRLLLGSITLFFTLFTLGFWTRWHGVDTGIWLVLGWLAWSWASLWLAVNGRLHGQPGWLWCCILSLTGVGAVTLLQLAVGSHNARWLDYAHKYLVLITLSGWLLAPLTALDTVTLKRFFITLVNSTNPVWVWLRWFAPLVLGGVLLLQPLVGSERGLSGVQPVEAVKFLLPLMLAFVGLRLTELRRTGGREFAAAPLGFIAAALGATVLFFVFANAMMVAVNDISPVLLLCLLLLPLAWRIAPHPTGLPSAVSGWLRGGVLFFLVLGIGLMAWIYNEPGTFAQGLPYGERFRVWTDPLAHPHSGAQVLQAMAYAAASDWLPSLEMGDNGGVMNLPAVQDDFIATFLIVRFGKGMALVLLAVQLVFLALSFLLARRVRQWGLRSDYRERMTGETLSLAIYGLAWMFAGHWLVSWGNVLGLMPVMGQPMTWLSAANSHMIFFALPGSLLILSTAWLLKEVED